MAIQEDEGKSERYRCTIPIEINVKQTNSTEGGSNLTAMDQIKNFEAVN